MKMWRKKKLLKDFLDAGPSFNSLVQMEFKRAYGRKKTLSRIKSLFGAITELPSALTKRVEVKLVNPANQLKVHLDREPLDAVLIEPRKEPVFLFKKLGQARCQVTYCDGKAKVSEGFFYYRNKRKPPKDFKGFSSEAIEIPLSLLYSKHIKFKRTILLNKLREALKNLDAYRDLRGNRMQTRQEEVVQETRDIMLDRWNKDHEFPSVLDILKKIYDRGNRKYISESTIRRIFNEFTQSIISKQAKGIGELTEWLVDHPLIEKKPS